MLRLDLLHAFGSFWWSSKNKSIKFYVKVNNLGALDQTVPTFLCCPFLSGFYSTVALFFYYLLVLYRAVTQNVKPPRTFLLCKWHVWVHPQLSSSLLSVAGKHYLVNPGLWTKRRHGHVFKGRLKKIGSKPLWEILQAASKWVKHDVCLVASQTLKPIFLTGRQSEKTSFLTF